MRTVINILCITVMLFITSCATFDVDTLLSSWANGDTEILQQQVDDLNLKVSSSNAKGTEDIKYILNFISMEMRVKKFISQNSSNEDLEPSDIDPLIDIILDNYKSMDFVSEDFKYSLEDYNLDYREKCVDLLVHLILKKEAYYLDKIRRTVRNISDDSYVTLISYIEDLNNLSYLSFISDVYLKTSVSKKLQSKSNDDKFNDVAKNLDKFFKKNINDFNRYKKNLLKEKDNFFEHKDDVEKLLEIYKEISDGWYNIERTINKIHEMAEKFKTIVDENNIKRTLKDVDKGLEELKEINDVYNRLSLRLYDIQTNKNIIDLDYFDKVIQNENRILDREKLSDERLGANDKIIDNIETIQDTVTTILERKQALRAEFLKIKALEIKEKYSMGGELKYKDISETYNNIFSLDREKVVYVESEGLLFELQFTGLTLQQLANLNFILFQNMLINNSYEIITTPSTKNWVDQSTRFADLQTILIELLSNSLSVNKFFTNAERIIRTYYLDQTYNQYISSYFSEFKAGNSDTTTYILLYLNDLIRSKPIHEQVNGTKDPFSIMYIYDFTQTDVDYGNLYYAYFKSDSYSNKNFRELEESKLILFNELLLLKYYDENSFDLTTEDLLSIPPSVIWPELNIEISKYLLDEFYSSKNKSYLLSSLLNINAYITKQLFITNNGLDSFNYLDRLNKFDISKNNSLESAQNIKLKILVELGRYDEARVLLSQIEKGDIQNILNNIEIAEYYENLLFNRKNKVLNFSYEQIEVEYQRVSDLKDLVQYFETSIKNKMMYYIGFESYELLVSDDNEIDHKKYLYIDNLKSLFLEKIIFSINELDEFDRVFLGDLDSNQNKDQLVFYIAITDLLKLEDYDTNFRDKTYERISNRGIYYKLLYYYWTNKKDFLYYLDKEVNNSRNKLLKFDIAINFLKYKFYLKYKDDKEIKNRIIGFDKMKDILLLTIENSNESNWTSINYNHYLEDIIKSYLLES